MERTVVLKFGGTSVATVARWKVIVAAVRKVIVEGGRPLIVCSALSKVSDQLEHLIGEAVRGHGQQLVEVIKKRHHDLAWDMQIDGDTVLREEFAELDRLVLGASLLRDSYPRLVARMMSLGELMSTRLGAAYLNSKSIRTVWVDARECLTSIDAPDLSEAHRVLSASVSDDADPELSRRIDSLVEPAIITQGFIARDASGGTVLLGRGGSDTSAALFAAKLGSSRCEIWTDVPGIFTADPRLAPAARLLQLVDFGEAQEIASMGAKVLHPRSIAPCCKHTIPIHIRWTEHPEVLGTRITRGGQGSEPQVKAICYKQGITLVSMDTPGMWQQVGFLADVFGCFRSRGLSVDLVSTSEMNVTASLDSGANVFDLGVVDGLLQDLAKFCKARVIGPCAAVSLVGCGIRSLLPRLGDVFEAFSDKHLYLMSQAASDLNLTFVVDESQAEALVQDLHRLLFSGRSVSSSFGPTWKALNVQERKAVVRPWWWQRRKALLALAQETSPLYVYDLHTISERAASLRQLVPISRLFYAVKANDNEGVLRCIERAGFGFECVSQAETEHVRSLFPELEVDRILFTPNFAARAEYMFALEQGFNVTVDNLYVLEHWPELFHGRSIMVRIDPGTGHGHHAHVRTGGDQSKFGIPLTDLEKLLAAVEESGARVIGLHAHVGSGVFDPKTWGQTAEVLAEVAGHFSTVRVLDLGGGLGIPERSEQEPVDLRALEEFLGRVQHLHPQYELWMEPGRFLVAEAGVLLGHVSQLKRKNGIAFVGTDIGMNSLIRPALYGAHHEIVNLSRLEDEATDAVNVVGPICESGDVVGYDRKLPPTREGDVLLVATAGAYGHTMSSQYNRRQPASERLLEE